MASQKFEDFEEEDEELMVDGRLYEAPKTSSRNIEQILIYDRAVNSGMIQDDQNSTVQL